MPVTWYNATVIRLEDASPRVRRFWLNIEEEIHFAYLAGQFITLDLPVGEKRLHRWRSYSLASAPGDGPVLELCIVRMDGGLATTYLFDQVSVGSSLRFKGPEGSFVLPEPVQQDLVLVCTGTGVAPFRSMLRDLDQRGWPARQVHLIYGSRTRQDLLYADEFLDLAARQPLFTYSAALSRLEAPASEDWITQGYVHDVYSQRYATPHPDRRFMLCGWTPMIDQAVETLLLRHGYERQQVSYELYG